ncbi:TnsD family Tn7-like transposition protein [Bacillus sp. J33]|uniref:TnsD family Tn7-like transposition protein n=1 Tax=Bacillus sp. J33 TaxID=935836 RepID=UPI0004B3BCC0|nr:TnsD family Tn7-like transposition protein [Bacillus sp. J33]
MIFFPCLYEDELFYSVLARYHQYSGNENSKITMEEVFGSSTLCAATTLPSNFRKLVRRLPIPESYSDQQLINNHTFLPYFAPFIPNERYQELKLMMSESDGKFIYMKIGIPASKIKSPDYLRYCLECVETEKALHGECFWHRVHQAEGVVVCPKHGCYLTDSDVPYSERKNKHDLASLGKSVHLDKVSSSQDDSVQFKHRFFISEQTFYLLNNLIKPFGLENLRRFYIARLKQQGFATISGRIKWVDLIPKFNQFYGVSLLKELKCYISETDEDTWLHKVLRKPKVSCHPLRHILLLGFLGETILSLQQQINSDFEPFGSGPWPCLNRAAEHFKKPVVISCKITNDFKMKVPVGTFTCTCGFVYSRRGPDKKEDDLYKIGRIKTFGPVWEQKLAELSTQDLSLRKKAEILGVDPMTVKNKLNIKEQLTENNSVNPLLEGYRKEWSLLIKNNGDKTVTELRSLNPSVYLWLYRNDERWLKEHSPKARVSKVKNLNQRVDWESRDKDVAEQVELIAKEIINGAGEVTRVSKNEIGRRISTLSLTSFINYIDRLPKTREALEKHVESIEQFQIRRIKYFIGELKKSKASLSEWEVIRAAGLKSEFADKLKHIIIKEIYRV